MFFKSFSKNHKKKLSVAKDLAYHSTDIVHFYSEASYGNEIVLGYSIFINKSRQGFRLFVCPSIPLWTQSPQMPGAQPLVIYNFSLQMIFNIYRLNNVVEVDSQIFFKLRVRVCGILCHNSYKLLQLCRVVLLLLNKIVLFVQ